MILNWKQTTRKLCRPSILFMQQIAVKKLTRIDFSSSDESSFQGDFITGADKDQMVECHDGVYLVRGDFITVQARPELGGVTGAALFVIQGDKVTLKGQTAGDDWPLQLRGLAVDLLKQQPDPLARFTEEELEKALAARRGNKPERPKKVIVGKQASR